MGKHDALAKTLAIIGTVLVVLPLLAPLAFGLLTIGRPGGYRLDYLMPFEVYPVTLVGVALLVWASLRARARTGAVGIAVGGMIGGLVLCAIAAQVTGIAQSEERLEAWRYVLTAGLGGVSLLAQIALVVIGFMLVRDLFAAPDEVAPPGARAPGA
ncbi:MAG: hypothetical protein WC971_04170 [Coriobacteriia bacterium]